MFRDLVLPQPQNRQKQTERARKELEGREQKFRETAQNLRRRDQAIKEKEKRLAGATAAAEEERHRLEKIINEEKIKLERVSGMTADEAKKTLMQNLRTEARFDAAAELKEIKDESQRNGEREAQKIIALAIERQAADYSNERTATAVKIPNEKIKGRLIGLEGRNIKAFEKNTGIQLIVDESPESVVLSGFNLSLT